MPSISELKDFVLVLLIMGPMTFGTFMVATWLGVITALLVIGLMVMTWMDSQGLIERPEEEPAPAGHGHGH